jgi:hypothetical protein
MRLGHQSHAEHMRRRNLMDEVALHRGLRVDALPQFQGQRERRPGNRGGQHHPLLAGLGGQHVGGLLNSLLECVRSELRRRRHHHLTAVALHQRSPGREQRISLAVRLTLEVGGVMILAIRAGRVAAIPHLAGALAPRGGCRPQLAGEHAAAITDRLASQTGQVGIMRDIRIVTHLDFSYLCRSRVYQRPMLGGDLPVPPLCVLLQQAQAAPPPSWGHCMVAALTKRRVEQPAQHEHATGNVTG